MKTKILVLIVMAIFILSGFTVNGKECIDPKFTLENEEKQALVIVLNENGQVKKIIDNNCLLADDPKNYEVLLENRYEKGKKIIFKVKDGNIYFYRLDVIMNKSNFVSVPVYKGQVADIKAQLIAPNQGKDLVTLPPVILSGNGMTYNIAITRYISQDEMLSKSKDGLIIFERSFRTYARYYLGSHLGFLIPFERSTSYGLLYQKPDDTKPIITEDTSTDTKMLFFGSIYPFGFEPERSILSKPYKRIHLDLGTELSGKIFKKLYFGVGYEFTYFSISLFACREEIGTLKEGFVVGGEMNPKNAAVPLDYKSHTSFSIVVGLPLDIATNWLGGVLGFK